ncbi:tripartite tricarboxylate transporter substrate binding protein [Bordetella sp. BOR01]|uniref:Bug family tripartite tricarboxylate transporter substrate binding protein n=1 Tax=Bordetella sp. BOR01 TaxID=2854779 RepID=UPI001C43993B|nr:tripartite tricarboxylate transporter substrate binding protein [Bordetella sp. BOR01]MBV7484614.1 tripartite tricarboxylate transporter substrate binding protein [Bordetella sp. BOR01]
MLKALVLSAAAVLSLQMANPPTALAAYPERPITLVVPFSAGASTDTLARLMGQAVSETLGQNIIVENRPGAGGIIAADYLRRQQPDGYTFMLTTDGIMSVNPSIHKKLAYQPLKDFTPLTIAAVAPVVLIVRSDSPFKSVQDIIEFAKDNPAGTLTFGSSGIGTSQHIAGELFNQLAHVELKHIPYKGGAPAMTDLLGGHLSMMFGQIPSAKEAAQQGKVRILAIGSPTRSPMLPDVPTLAELGLAGYDSDTWYGFSLPGGTPEEVQMKLYKALAGSLQSHREQLEQLGYVVLGSTPADMASTIESNTVKWQGVLQQAGIYHMQ